MKIAGEIGPPARMMRWCCSMFKTGPITRYFNKYFKANEKFITFYGIRACESVSRSKYSRVSSRDNEDEVKISNQIVAAPIFEWKDIDVWLYILHENLDFNDAYRYGFTRVGCWLCPNNNNRSQFLSRITTPEQASEWRNFLIRFAKSIGKSDPEEYVDGGWWKARQGGNGLRAANDVKIQMSNCTTEADAKVYSLNRPVSDEFYNLFTPFGALRQDNRGMLAHDLRSSVPILSITPFGIERDNSVKIRIMNVGSKDRAKLERQISYQVLKYNACRFCLKCESLCKYGAISLRGGVYAIDDKKCQRCKMCVEQKYLQGGCMMTKYLRTKK
jgi:phosphoadenosine phosphosulfate reductase